MNKTIIRLAAILGAIGVGLGAFGAHALKSTLLASGHTDLWTKAVFYHLLHAVAVLVRGIGFPNERGKRSAWCWSIGVLLFSGSLYGLALTSWSWLGPVTPIGGVFLILGWLFLIFEA